MHKLVVDTNIIVSALIAKGFSSQILYELVMEGKVEFCLSQQIWEEYISVLSRERFRKYPQFHINADIVLSKVEEIAVKHEPTIEVTVLKDITDNKFLELAVFSKSDFIITGNINDFTMQEFEGIKIVSPRDYWEKYREV